MSDYDLSLDAILNALGELEMEIEEDLGLATELNGTSILVSTLAVGGLTYVMKGNEPIMQMGIMAGSQFVAHSLKRYLRKNEYLSYDKKTNSAYVVLVSTALFALMNKQLKLSHDLTHSGVLGAEASILGEVAQYIRTRPNSKKDKDSNSNDDDYNCGCN